MSKNILSVIVRSTFLCLLLVGLVVAQKAPKYVAEGVIIAFQRNNRCPSCEGNTGNIATAIENWIVRVDKWNDEKFDGNKYVLVEYQMYNRSLSEYEINKKLKFVLRERMEHEQNHDCIGEITYKKGDDYFLRPVEFSDYELTESGKLESIPADLKKLPCFIVDRLPKILK
jgi:hypothetical protein